ncbi:uncharacterized protein BCR38DRAFT_334077 [Pseudomassariella vexata]|uniref:J domain-containing protein n=1 Tax=Pseudomassariella vexata TaxID=1141098 RepID=A0A1Y2EF38_9PEZI|nr:uncharacterized protein BCR38DRAFT_334077 [Pseudomassariella vexata]ORY70169.1 hypothetical protein BCR38DRAFT_334077 [Pseudomassariella vexata]
MTNQPLSPRRRHVLSSINPKGTQPHSSVDDVCDDVDDKAEREPEPSSHRHHRRRCHHRHRHKRRHSRSSTPPNPYEPPPLDPDAAFRESLFDAMADDEGAAYWQGVYGQPLHVYSNAKPGPSGELEKMTDDEYAAYVRCKMWEKTHQGLLEERARKDEEKTQRESHRRTRDTEDDDARLHRDMEESLRRGEARRSRKSWQTRWNDYVKTWSNWDGTSASMNWPVKTRRREDINGEDVRDFFIHCLDPKEIGEAPFLAKLKEERVRWHPDKMQQKSGHQLDETVMRDVTAVFQIIDELWAYTRPKAN